MAEDSPLSPDGNLTEWEYEQLAGRVTASGLVGAPGDPDPVTVQGGTLVIRAGLRANVRGFPWYSGADPVVWSPSLAGPTRTDLLVVRLDRLGGFVVASALKGGTAGNPAPTPSTGDAEADAYEIPLCEATIGGGAIVSMTPRWWWVGAEGVHLAESGTQLPPHALDRRVLRTDTGRAYRSNDTSWVLVQDDSGPLQVTTLPGFAATVNDLRRVNGLCVLNVKVMRTNGPIPAGSVIKVADLPAGFAPPAGKPAESTALWWSGAQPVNLRVTSGGLYVVTPAGVSVADDRTVDGQIVWHAATPSATA